ncbi:metallophosphoesterase [Burkholderiaceae bacterium DAT-1]|nr:metallophosphoesterase [Burkholderiaceae bacterium DAT-1]
MKLAIYSDLHIEFAAFQPPKTDADVAILAGDIATGVNGLKWIKRNLPNIPVVYVVGNHEFYGSSLESTWQDLRRLCPANVHLLENESVIIDGVRFLGCTLWTDYAFFGADKVQEAMELCAQSISDHFQISTRRDIKKRKFSPEDALNLHITSRQWLKDSLSDGSTGRTVVVTHHAPSSGSVSDRFSADMLTSGYASDLSDLMGVPQLWIHGHMHESFDYSMNGTRIICNPRGYRLNTGAFENAHFNPALIVEI